MVTSPNPLWQILIRFFLVPLLWFFFYLLFSYPYKMDILPSLIPSHSCKLPTRTKEETICLTEAHMLGWGIHTSPSTPGSKPPNDFPDGPMVGARSLMHSHAWSLWVQKIGVWERMSRWKLSEHDLRLVTVSLSRGSRTHDSYDLGHELDPHFSLPWLPWSYKAQLPLYRGGKLQEKICLFGTS